MRPFSITNSGKLLKIIFVYFFKAINSGFVKGKIVQNFLIFVYLFFLKNSTIDSQLINSGMVGGGKLADHLLNCILNTLLVGVQYTVSFQRTNFGPKCLNVSESNDKNLTKMFRKLLEVWL